MTSNKIFVTIVAAALLSVALPAGAYHIDHHSGPTGTSVTWNAGTGDVIDVCETDRDPITGLALEGQGGLCYAHNHTETNVTDRVGPATSPAPGDPFETTALGHHTDNTSHTPVHLEHPEANHNSTNWVNHSDHGVIGNEVDDTLDNGIDVPIASVDCSEIVIEVQGNETVTAEDHHWTGLDLTRNHQAPGAVIAATYFAQISGVDSTAVDATIGESFVYHEETACLVTDGHATIFVDSANVVSGITTGSYTTFGGVGPCPAGDRVCAQ